MSPDLTYSTDSPVMSEESSLNFTPAISAFQKNFENNQILPSQNIVTISSTTTYGNNMKGNLLIPTEAGLGNTSSDDDDHMLHVVRQYTNEVFWFSMPTLIILIIAYSLVIVTGLIGNLMVVVVICRKKELRSFRNIFILNLSVCDVIMCSVCMPFSLVKLSLKKWTLGLFMCRMAPAALATIDVFVSTITIVVIALDRYLSIVHSRQMTTRQVMIALVAIWVFSILLSTPLFCFHKINIQKMYDHIVVQQCIDAWPDELFRKVYTTIVMLFQYLTPAGVISYLHAKICRFLRFRLQERPGADTQITAKAQADMRRYRRTMVLLTAMALVFCVTWLPLTILNIMADLQHEVFLEKQYNLIHAISLLIAMSSSVLNPLMYGWFNSNFRKAFSELIGRDLNSFNSQRMKHDDENCSPFEKKDQSNSDRSVENIRSKLSDKAVSNIHTNSDHNGSIVKDFAPKAPSSEPLRKHMWKLDRWKSLDQDSSQFSQWSRKDSSKSFDSRKFRIERASRSSDSGRSIRERIDSLKSTCSIKGYRRMEETIEPTSPDLSPTETDLSKRGSRQDETQTLRAELRNKSVFYESTSPR